VQITASALSLNVGDPVASATFAKQHLGFTEDIAGDGFVSLSKQDAGLTSSTFARAWRASNPTACAGGTRTACWSSSSSTTSTRSTRDCSGRACRSRRPSRPSRGESGSSRLQTPTESSSNSSNGWWTPLDNDHRLRILRPQAPAATFVANPCPPSAPKAVESRDLGHVSTVRGAAGRGILNNRVTRPAARDTSAEAPVVQGLHKGENYGESLRVRR